MNNLETVTTEEKAFVAGLAKKARSKKAVKSAKGKAKVAKTKKAGNPADGRDGSKKAIILELLRRKGGATIAELAKATSWQNHSVRGFLSAQVGKKMGLKVESEKNEAGERGYRVA